MVGGSGPKTKGLRYEREAETWLRVRGLAARRTAASGAQRGHIGDIEVPDLDLSVEVKWRADDRGTTMIRRYLKDVDILMMRSPGEPWIFILGEDQMARFLEVMAESERKEQAG
jgi:Holliday junction resolvase